MSAAILQNPGEHMGRTYPLFGLVEMDHEQMASELSEALGRKIVFQNVSIDEYSKSLEAMGLPEYIIQHFEGAMDAYLLNCRMKLHLHDLPCRAPSQRESWVSGLRQPALELLIAAKLRRSPPDGCGRLTHAGGSSTPFRWANSPNEDRNNPGRVARPGLSFK